MKLNGNGTKVGAGVVIAIATALITGLVQWGSWGQQIAANTQVIRTLGTNEDPIMPTIEQLEGQMKYMGRSIDKLGVEIDRRWDRQNRVNDEVLRALGRIEGAVNK